MLFFFLLLEVLTTDNTQTTVMATHKGAPQVILHEKPIDDNEMSQNQEDLEDLADTFIPIEKEN